jgi:hypothetical protein
MKEVSQT